jgi:uncharacterized FlaG/YvyC family protein
VGSPVATPIAQPASEAAHKAVTTELPAPQSVTAADASVRARNDSQSATPSVSRQVIVDQAAASIVYQVVDNLTNTVVTQFPDEAVLRRRAYFHTLDLTRSAPTRLAATDRMA